MNKCKLKYMFDWGSGVCVWSANSAAEALFNDYPIETDKLPISEELKEKLEYLIELHDKALNWDNPGGNLLWDEKQTDHFFTEVKTVYESLCEEMGNEYEIELVCTL